MNELADTHTLPRYDLGELGNEAAVVDFQKYGCLHVSDFLPLSIIEELREEFQANYDRCINAGAFLIVGDKRLLVSVPVAGKFADPRVHSPASLQGLLKNLLGHDYVMNCYSCVVAQPGAKAQHTHTDYHGLFGSALDYFAPSYAINLFVPLVELNNQNGTTEMWPGSHRKPLVDKHQELGFCPNVPLGSAVLMDYRVVHRGTANRSTAPRPVLTLAFSRSWFLDMKNFASVRPLHLERSGYDKMDAASQNLFQRAKLHF